MSRVGARQAPRAVPVSAGYNGISACVPVLNDQSYRGPYPCKHGIQWRLAGGNQLSVFIEDGSGRRTDAGSGQLRWVYTAGAERLSPETPDLRSVARQAGHVAGAGGEGGSASRPWSTRAGSCARGRVSTRFSWTAGPVESIPAFFVDTPRIQGGPGEHRRAHTRWTPHASDVDGHRLFSQVKRGTTALQVVLLVVELK